MVRKRRGGREKKRRSKEREVRTDEEEGELRSMLVCCVCIMQ